MTRLNMGVHTLCVFGPYQDMFWYIVLWCWCRTYPCASTMDTKVDSKTGSLKRGRKEEENVSPSEKKRQRVRATQEESKSESKKQYIVGLEVVVHAGRDVSVKLVSPTELRVMAKGVKKEDMKHTLKKGTVKLVIGTPGVSSNAFIGPYKGVTISQDGSVVVSDGGNVTMIGTGGSSSVIIDGVTIVSNGQFVGAGAEARARMDTTKYDFKTIELPTGTTWDLSHVVLTGRATMDVGIGHLSSQLYANASKSGTIRGAYPNDTKGISITAGASSSGKITFCVNKRSTINTLRLKSSSSGNVVVALNDKNTTSVETARLTATSSGSTYIKAFGLVKVSQLESRAASSGVSVFKSTDTVNIDHVQLDATSSASVCLKGGCVKVKTSLDFDAETCARISVSDKLVVGPKVRGSSQSTTMGRVNVPCASVSPEAVIRCTKNTPGSWKV